MKITTRYHEDPYALHIGTEPQEPTTCPRPRTAAQAS